MSNEVVEDLMEYCRAKNRICPMPQQWNKLWEMLPGRGRLVSSLRPPSPLMLSSWYDSTPEMKRERLAAHIQWAVKHHAIVPVVSYLYGLDEEDWLHYKESLRKYKNCISS